MLNGRNERDNCTNCIVNVFDITTISLCYQSILPVSITDLYYRSMLPVYVTFHCDEVLFQMLVFIYN